MIGSCSAPAQASPLFDPSLADRLARLEARSAEHAHAVQQFVTVMARTDSNLQRLAVELDRLLTRLEIRVVPQSPPANSEAAAVVVGEPAVLEAGFAVASETDVNPFPPAPAVDFYSADEDDEEPPRRGWKTSAAVLAILLCMLVGAVLVIRQAQKVSAGGNGASASSIFSPMERARMLENEKKFPAAEATYREILGRDPHNADAIRHLASVLFRENKIEESSVVLKQLVPAGSDQ